MKERLAVSHLFTYVSLLPSQNQIFLKVIEVSYPHSQPALQSSLQIPRRSSPKFLSMYLLAYVYTFAFVFCLKHIAYTDSFFHLLFQSLFSLRNIKENWTWWHIPVTLALLEAEAGGSQVQEQPWQVGDLVRSYFKIKEKEKKKNMGSRNITQRIGPGFDAQYYNGEKRGKQSHWVVFSAHNLPLFLYVRGYLEMPTLITIGLNIPGVILQGQTVNSQPGVLWVTPGV